MASDAPAIDTAVLDELLRGSAALGRRMVELFERECAVSMEALQAALVRRDRDRIRFHAHRLVGSARVVGAMALGAAAKALETACREGADMDELEHLATAATTTLEPARTALRQHVDGLAGQA